MYMYIYIYMRNTFPKCVKRQSKNQCCNVSPEVMFWKRTLHKSVHIYTNLHIDYIYIYSLYVDYK